MPAPDPAAETGLPAAVSRRLLQESDAIARRMVRRLSDEIPLGGQYSSPAYLRLVVRACRDALRALLRQLHDGRRAHPAELAALGSAGVRQAEMDVPLEVLLRGYRVAAKVVWREVIEEAVRRGELSPPMVVALSEQVLEYLDNISGAVGSAYLETRERRLRRVDRERDLLLQRLVNGDTSPELQRLATTAGLDLSPPWRVVAIHLAGGDDRGLAAAWSGVRALITPDGVTHRIALVDPSADAGQLQRRAAARLGAPVVVALGPLATRLEDVAAAAGRARRALHAGRLLEPGETVLDETAVGVLAAAAGDAELLDDHLRATLGPLLDPRRADLVTTLETVLETRGPAEAAAALGVHRHTVGYRLDRAATLLGVDVDDPVVRHRLWLALRLLRLRAVEEATSGSSPPPPQRARA